MGNSLFLIVGPVFPRSVSKRCPAIMLAANRIANVPGRITFLTVSIRTISGVRPIGVPAGTRWANMCFVWFSHPKIIKQAQRGRAKDRVIATCLVLVKIYGIRPKKLLNTINLNNEMNMIVIPGLALPKRALNSLCKFIIIEDQKREDRLGLAQYK